MKALAVPGVNYAILATPPGFRSSHFKACSRGRQECLHGETGRRGRPGCRMMYAAAEAAKQKNLKVAAGTQRRHQAGYIETIKRIQDGAIGDIVTLRAYWVNGGPIWHRGDHGSTDLERQIRNWYHYIWLCGDHICEQHVHNLDVCNWIMKRPPVQVLGHGRPPAVGRQVRRDLGQFRRRIRIRQRRADVQLLRPDQTRMVLRSAKASRAPKAPPTPAGTFPKGGTVWRYRGDNDTDAYVQEHIDLINAIVNDTASQRGQTGHRQHPDRHHGPRGGLQRRRAWNGMPS